MEREIQKKMKSIAQSIKSLKEKNLKCYEEYKKKKEKRAKLLGELREKYGIEKLEREIADLAFKIYKNGGEVDKQTEIFTDYGYQLSKIELPKGKIYIQLQPWEQKLLQSKERIRKVKLGK